MKSKVLLIILLAGITAVISGQDISINQIDTSRLFTSSTIDCYISILDNTGEPVEENVVPELDVSHETSTGMKPVDILKIEKNENAEDGVTFLLLLDNSGSMYTSIGGGLEGTRMDHAKRGVQAFLNDLDTERDTVGIAAFNTNYTLLTEPAGDAEVLEQALQSVKKPENEEVYTEIYYSLTEASADIARFNGRKAIIILSDGENMPYSADTGNPHPVLGDKIYIPDEALEILQREEITLYVINFAPEKDEPLADISLASGGTVFNARNDSELTGVYQEIRKGIEKEYKVTVKVPITFIDSPAVEIKTGTDSDTREYTATLIFGKPGDWLWLIFLAVLAGAILLWLILMAVKLEKPAKKAEISMLPSGAGKALQKTMILSTGKTVIGGAPQADFTVAGIPSMKDSHATIIQDDKTSSYTLICDTSVMVNNKPVTKKKLQPGDVINVEGATIVFDAPEKK